jgi:broad specificity phosphatase PhoE
MRFFLIRHGQSEASIKKIIAGHSDIPLTKLGKEQANALGQYLLESGIKFDAVYSSDIVRASDTATIMRDKLGIKEIIYDKRLREHDAGIFTGRKGSSLTKEEKEFLENTMVDLNLRVPGGETNKEMTLRIEEAFNEIVTNNPEDSTILLIGHGGTLYHILVRILELLPSKMEEWFGNCAKNILERNSQDDAWRITMFNNKHLKM